MLFLPLFCAPTLDYTFAKAQPERPCCLLLTLHQFEHLCVTGFSQIGQDLHLPNLSCGLRQWAETIIMNLALQFIRQFRWISLLFLSILHLLAVGCCGYFLKVLKVLFLKILRKKNPSQKSPQPVAVETSFIKIHQNPTTTNESAWP